MLRAICIAFGLGLASGTVYAGDCEDMGKEVASAIENVELSETMKAKVDMLRARGEEERKAGNELSCVVALEEALELLKS